MAVVLWAGLLANDGLTLFGGDAAGREGWHFFGRQCAICIQVHELHATNGHAMMQRLGFYALLYWTVSIYGAGIQFLTAVPPVINGIFHFIHIGCRIYHVIFIVQ